MKKLLLVLLIGLFALTMVAGCGQKEEPKTPPVEKPTVEAVPDSGVVVDSAVVEEEATEESGQ